MVQVTVIIVYQWVLRVKSTPLRAETRYPNRRLLLSLVGKCTRTLLIKAGQAVLTELLLYS